jgi:murein L,D-transpeptidase YafK
MMQPCWLCEKNEENVPFKSLWGSHSRGFIQSFMINTKKKGKKKKTEKKKRKKKRKNEKKRKASSLFTRQNTNPLKPQDRFDSVDIAYKSEYKFLSEICPLL